MISISVSLACADINVGNKGVSPYRPAQSEPGRSPVKENDIPDIVARFRDLAAEADRPRTAQSFLVPKAEIVENGYDLSINKYKQTEYKPVEYPPTSEILTELNEIEMEITRALAELEEMV